MIYGLLFIIILIYCYEYWKMISKYKYLFFQEENTVENLDNNNKSKKTPNQQSKLIKESINEPFSDKHKSNQFTPYNFTQLSNHAIDVSSYNETTVPDLKQDELIKMQLRNLEGKVLTFLNKLIKNYTNLISDTLQEIGDESAEAQKEKIENLILENNNNILPLIDPNMITKLFDNNNNKLYALSAPALIRNRIIRLKEGEANLAAKDKMTDFMENIFTELDKIKDDYQINNMSNLEIAKKYLQSKPIYSKYYPNDLYASKKLNEKHQYLNKPTHREDLPCKWKCQRSWFQCHYSLDN